jgi:hypothetical protein
MKRELPGICEGTGPVYANVFLRTNPLDTIRMGICMGRDIRQRKIHGTPVTSGMLALALMLVFVLFAGCAGTAPARPAPAPVPAPILQNHTVSSIELIFFHPVPGCDSCDRVSILANETVTAYFSRERAAGKITFRDINLNDPANRAVAKRYGASTESLFIGVNDESGFRATEIVDIWYYAYDHEGFMQYLKGILDRTLAGKE